MLTITDPRHGAILNRHDGTETDTGLEISVSGICQAGLPVEVNGQQAVCRGSSFHAILHLSSRETRITAVQGTASVTITVLYDQHSIPRYRFSLDDNIWFLRDIAEKRYRSVFENPYMALWKRLHDTYGTKVNCNVYFQCEDFNLTMMPDVYRGEWQDNADWFRMTFHALQNDPDRPYIHSGYDEVAHDFDLVTNEIIRFAGPEVTNTFTTIHWGEATRDGCRAVRDRGIRGLCAYFIFGRDGNPAVSYYADADLTRYMATRDYWKDMEEDLIFIRHDMVINTVSLVDIIPRFEATVREPGLRDVMEIMIHEQYFYPHYRAYVADYVERCETAVRWLTENGYEPVFWSEGFLGH